MDTIEYLDIYGNAIPSALVQARGDYKPYWSDGFLIQTLTVNIPRKNPKKSITFEGTTMLAYFGTDSEVRDMYNTMYDIGIKFSFKLTEITGSIYHLVDAIKFGECFYAVYVRCLDNVVSIATVFLNDRPQKTMDINDETAGGIETYSANEGAITETLNLSLLLMSTSTKVTCPFVVYYKDSYGNSRIAGDYRITIRDIDIVEKFGDFKDKKITNSEYGTYSSSGGYGGGSFDDSSDAFGLPSLPSLGVSQAGFVNVYKPTAGQLVGFADDLFPDFEMPTPSTKEGIDGVVENLNNVASVLGFFADSYLNKGLVDYVIDCHIVPVAPSITDNTGIKVGYKTFNYNPNKVTSDYVEFDCGSLQIAEYYQNFLDYEGTRAKLYCPFVGFVDIKPEWFQSGNLRLVYHFNIIDGSCIAFVIATSSKSKLRNTVVATFGGNCCVHMPITGLNYSSMISGIASGTGKIVSGVFGGNLGQIAGGAEQVATARPSIEQSNGYNAGMSFMCYRRPYLLIERPVASFSQNYPKEEGLPLNVTKKLSEMKGFTTCTAPIIDNFHCLEEEKELIKQALIEGTIF